jgi:transposase
MKTLSMDLRERIVKTYDQGNFTRQQIAERYGVSLGMVKKLIQQRRHTGDLRPRHYRSGRKPLFTGAHRRELRRLVARRPDMTLSELREALGLACSLPAVHYVLEKMGLTYKKRRSTPANSAART